MFEKERLSGAMLRDEVLELLARIELERKRIAGLDSKMKQIEGQKAAKAEKAADAGEKSFEGMAREDIIEQVKQRYQPGHATS